MKDLIENNYNSLPVQIKRFLTSNKLNKIKKADWINVSIDSLINLINFISPYGGLIASEIASIKSIILKYKEEYFFRKFVMFAYGIKNVKVEDRKKFMEEVETASKDFSGNVISEMISRIDNINKAETLANLVNARVNDLISINDFFRLSNVIEKIPYTDFKYLQEFVDDNYLADGITELLYSTGVLRLTLISGNSKEANLYGLSGLGVKLLVYGFKIPVKEKEGAGTTLPIASQEDVRNILKKENVVTYDIEAAPTDDK